MSNVTFPPAPEIGDTVVGPFGEIYAWDGVKWTLTSNGGGGGASVDVGSEPPSGAKPGHLWWNTDEGRLYIWNAQGVWVGVSAPGGAVDPPLKPGSRVLLRRFTITSPIPMYQYIVFQFDNTYDEFVLDAYDIRATGDTALNARFSSDGGATFDATAAYVTAAVLGDHLGNVTGQGSTNNNLTYLLQPLVGTGGNIQPSVGTIRLFKPWTPSPTYKTILWDSTNLSSLVYRRVSGMGVYGGLLTPNAFGLWGASADIIAGVFNFYGIAK